MIDPITINKMWTTLASSQWNNYDDNGYRLDQRGTGNPSLLVCFEADLDLHFEIDPQRIYDRIMELGDRLLAGLAVIDGVEIVTSKDSMGAGLTTFRVPGVDDKKMQTAL